MNTAKELNGACEMVYKTFSALLDNVVTSDNELNFYPSLGYIYFAGLQKPVRLKTIMLGLQPVSNTGSGLNPECQFFINMKPLIISSEQSQNQAIDNNVNEVVQNIELIDVTEQDSIILSLNDRFTQIFIDMMATGIRIESIQLKRSQNTRRFKFFLTFGYETF